MATNPKTISAIVVDDDKVIVRLLSERLYFCGINVIGVGYNGNEAVELYERLKPDIVFLDIMMPSYDGFFALGNIRKINNHAKILMVTAVIREEFIEKLKGFSSVEIVDKTFDFDDLLNAVNKLMESQIDGLVFKGEEEDLRSPVLK